MQHVPQFIDTRDKVAGPLTWEQLYWMGGALGIGVVLWQLLQRTAFWVAIIPIVVAALAFAFIRPQKISLLTFLKYAVIYYFTPRMYLWQREVNNYDDASNARKNSADDQLVPTLKKAITTDDISSLSKVLDSHGEMAGEEIQKIIHRNTRGSASDKLWKKGK